MHGPPIGRHTAAIGRPSRECNLAAGRLRLNRQSVKVFVARLQMVEEFIPIFGILFGIGGPAVDRDRVVHAELLQAPQADGAASHRAHGGHRARHGNSAAADRADRRSERAEAPAHGAAARSGVVLRRSRGRSGRARRPRRGHSGVPRADPARHRSRVSHLLLRRGAQRRSALAGARSRARGNNRPPGI